MATSSLLLAGSEEYGDSGTTQKKDVEKTPATMLPSTLSRQCMCTIRLTSIFFVNNHLKVENMKLDISGYKQLL